MTNVLAFAALVTWVRARTSDFLISTSPATGASPNALSSESFSGCRETYALVTRLLAFEERRSEMSLGGIFGSRQTSYREKVRAL